MSGTAASDTAPCGCCEGISPQTPGLVSNRPGLSQIGYRVGTYANFKASLLTALSEPANSPLGLLTTRDDSDFTIALLDAFAVTSDILTFYQERLANKSYLRTATLPGSVFELARLVGYQPSRGWPPPPSGGYPEQCPRCRRSGDHPSPGRRCRACLRPASLPQPMKPRST